MDLELVSFKLCPYVQRAKITLGHKDVDHKTTYIDLADPPAWFQERSPLGKVPIVTVDSKTTLFESAVINEFVDEVTGGGLLPDDPVEKARARAWIEFASACLVDQYLLSTAGDKEGFTQHRDALCAKFAVLEKQLGEGPYFLGDMFSLVDTSFAPLFMRVMHLNQDGALFAKGTYPKTEAWADHLLALPEVQASIAPEWKDLMASYLDQGGAYVGTRLTATA